VILTNDGNGMEKWPSKTQELAAIERLNGDHAELLRAASFQWLSYCDGRATICDPRLKALPVLSSDESDSAFPRSLISALKFTPESIRFSCTNTLSQFSLPIIF
jgi:hypothetical protein